MERRGERDCKENVEGRFPLTFWEVAGASAVVGAFVLGLACVYLTMPASDYSFLKLPRSLEDIQILRYFLFSVCFQGICFLWKDLVFEFARDLGFVLVLCFDLVFVFCVETEAPLPIWLCWLGCLQMDFFAMESEFSRNPMWFSFLRNWRSKSDPTVCYPLQTFFFFLIFFLFDYLKLRLGWGWGIWFPIWNYRKMVIILLPFLWSRFVCLHDQKRSWEFPLLISFPLLKKFLLRLCLCWLHNIGFDLGLFLFFAFVELGVLWNSFLEGPKSKIT